MMSADNGGGGCVVRRRVITIRQASFNASI
jgi:hypothetical protein